MIIDCGLQEGWPTPNLPKLSNNETSINLTTDDESFVINLFYIGLGLGGLAPILMMDTIGRKLSLLIAGIPKIMSWILIGIATNNYHIYIGRLLAGISCGISYSILPMYIGEISMEKTRGKLGTLFALSINFGVLLMLTIGLFISRFTMSMFALVTPLIFIMTFVWLPESPVYLIRKNNNDNAIKAIKWSYGKDNIDDEMDEIKKIVTCENETMNNGLFLSLKNSIRTNSTKRSFFIMFILCALLGLTGGASIFSYQVKIFDRAGLDIGTNFSIILTGFSIVIGGTACVTIVKYAGKRKILLIATPIAGLAMLLLSIFFTLLENNINVGYFNWLPTFCIVIFAIIYGIAFNSVPYAYLGEIFTFEVKVIAGIFSSIYYSISNVATVKMFQVFFN